jgi:hypothetical protein
LDLSGNTWPNAIIGNASDVDTLVDRIKFCPCLETLTLINVPISDEDKEDLKKKLGDRSHILKFE